MKHFLISSKALPAQAGRKKVLPSEARRVLISSKARKKVLPSRARQVLIFCGFLTIFSIGSCFVINKIPYKELNFSFHQGEAAIINIKDKNNPYPKLNMPRLIEINLTDNKISFFNNGFLENTFNILSQGPYGKWYETPTGYYKVGSKEKSKISYLADPPVYMNYAVQLYEDFYIHEKTKYLDGTPTAFTFTGGCLRLDSSDALNFFNLVKTGDQIISYDSFSGYKIKDQFAPPVDYKNFWIRQRFNNPIRSVRLGSDDRSQEYIHHAGLDLAPEPFIQDLNVYNIYDGKISAIVKNGEGDHGLGNTIIIEHLINNQTIYSLYGHLKEIKSDLVVGEEIKKGDMVGIVGATGYGCDYWRVGEDGCESEGSLDTHLHFEFKTKPVLHSPVLSQCKINNKIVNCYGYTPSDPTQYGYLDPFLFLFEKEVGSI